MTIEEYKIIRNAGKDLAGKILDFKKSNREETIYAGKLLGFWDGKAMVFDSDDESDVLMDFLIYERNKRGVKLIDKFYDSETELNDIEEEILEGMVDYHSSLFEIININRESCILTLIDLFDMNHKEFELIDLGLSQTIRIGIVFYFRLLPIRDINITSGVSFGFDTTEKDKILSDISLARFKRKGKLNSTDLFVLTHKRSKQYGINIASQEMI
jgi:hypothetical protein